MTSDDTTRAPRRRRFRRRRDRPRESGDVLVDALRSRGLSDLATWLRIATVWSTTVGDRIASRTAPHSLTRGVLTVRSASAAWQNELTFLKQTILDRLNEALDAKRPLVRDIKVVAGAILPPEPTRVTLPPSTETELAQAQEAGAPIADPSVRASFVRALLAQSARRRAESKDP